MRVAVVVCLLTACCSIADPGEGHKPSDIHVFEDPGAAMSLDQIRAQPDTAWRPLEGQPGFGYSASAFWIRFTLPASDSSELFVRVGYPILDHVSLYMPGRNIEAGAGDAIPFAQRTIRHRDFVFVVPAASGELVYIRAQSSSSITAPITLWSRNGFLNSVNTENYILGAYFGILAVMVIYNMFLYFSVRDSSYLYYVLAISTTGIIMLCLNGMAFEYLWPDWPAWQQLSLPFFLFSGTAAISLFTMSFLKTNSITPWMHRLLLTLAVLAAVMAVLSLFLPPRKSLYSLNLMILVVVPSVIISGVLSLSRGYAPARFFLLAWAGFMAGALIHALRTLGILPVNLFTSYALYTGSATEVVLLSLALGYRIKLIRKEREEAQRLAAQSMHRAEKLQDELLSNVSHELNTPLASILAHAEMLRNGDFPAHEQEQVFQIIHIDSIRLARQVNNLMLVAKIGAQALTPAAENTSVQTVLDQVRESAALEFPDRRVEAGETDLTVPTDSTLLRCALHELVLNGLVFAGPEAKVRLDAEKGADEVRITVTDNGPGIPDHAIDIVTGRFARMDQSVTYRESGIGMGLFVAVKLAELLGGSLHLANRPDRGLRATLSLPAGRT